MITLHCHFSLLYSIALSYKPQTDSIYTPIDIIFGIKKDNHFKN